MRLLARRLRRFGVFALLVLELVVADWPTSPCGELGSDGSLTRYAHRAAVALALARVAASSWPVQAMLMPKFLYMLGP